MPSLDISVGGYTYTLPFTAYSTKGWGSSSRTGCSLLVANRTETTSNGSPDYSISLGLAFLTQYTTAFNVQDKSFQVAPSVFAFEGITVAVNPNDEITGTGGVSTWIIILIVLACLIFIILLIVIYVWY